ncbi:MAG: S41 family peptidase [Pseudomonadota bacterium]
MIKRIRTLTLSAQQSLVRLACTHTIMGLLIIMSQTWLNPHAAQASEVEAQSSDTDPGLQLDTFDAVWNQVSTQYFDYSRIESDWLQAREDYRPRAANASRSELRDLMNDMLEVVGESHFLVLPPTQISIPSTPSNQDGDPSIDSDTNDNRADSDAERSTGLGVRLIDGALIVDRVGEVNVDLIQPGWALVAIGDQVLQPVIEETLAIEETSARNRATLFLEASANGLIGLQSDADPIELTLLDGNDDEQRVTPLTFPDPVNVFQLGNLPGLEFTYRAQTLSEGDECIGRMTFSSWVPELMDRFEETRATLFACQGLIIDLRGNLGGVLTTMMPLTSHMINEMVLLGQLKREDGRIDFRAFPRLVADDGTRLTPFDGPVAILIDSLSASTSEMFSAGMQSLGRARVFGARSPGMALPAQMLPLPNGDRLMYAFADYIDGQGRRIEGVGVTPDEVVPLRRSELLQGQDPVIEAASRWLTEQAQQGASE